MTINYNSHDLAAKNILEQVGKKIVIGVPLGIGKPIGLLNALYRLASEDPSINLTIFTGLTLARPILQNELEKRLLQPIIDRMLQNYEDPLYERPRQLQQLPKNINVLEFFLTPGKYLHNNYVQQNYISSIYTCVSRDISYYSINVLAQQVARSTTNPESFSLSCNTDLFYQVKKSLESQQGRKVIIAAEVNQHLPFMPGEYAVVPAQDFNIIADTKHYPALFPLPREALSYQDHLIGLYTSCLIKDGGCLQIGIGKLSNAIASALIYRQKNNSGYQELLNKLAVTQKFNDIIAAVGSTIPFNQGLYASTEMLSDEYLQLYNYGILKKRVYDHIGLQQLLNSGLISEQFSSNILDVLIANNIIQPNLSLADFQFLQKFSIIKTDVKFVDSYLLVDGNKISADLTKPQVKQEIIDKCLGTYLSGGKIMHAAFFIGSTEFYKQLNAWSPVQLQQIDMTMVARTNSLNWWPSLLRLQRQQARFINSTMMVTLAGGSVSDGLQDMQMVSGVGGQFDFINMAQQLDQARAITILPSTHKTHKGVSSNIVWEYANQTIPHYLHDIFVTEYGIADCRSKTDADVIQALLNITDSRFQAGLLAKAKKAGKISQDYEIPATFQNNFPEAIKPIVDEAMRQGYCSPYPFGSDLTAEEEVIAEALSKVKYYNGLQRFSLICASLFYIASDAKYEKYLKRMQFIPTLTWKQLFYKKLLKWLLRGVV